MAELDSSTLAGLDDRSRSRMLDLGVRPAHARAAIASGIVTLGPEAFELLRTGQSQKGDVLAVANVAGVMAAKRTSLLLPMCHDVVLQSIELEFELDEASSKVHVKAIVKTEGPTGIEMEALTAVSIAALTIYDMCKSFSREICVSDIRLIAKSGGLSGDYIRTD